jgi:hypothetical protein
VQKTSARIAPDCNWLVCQEEMAAGRHGSVNIGQHLVSLNQSPAPVDGGENLRFVGESCGMSPTRLVNKGPAVMAR